MASPRLDLRSPGQHVDVAGGSPNLVVISASGVNAASGVPRGLSGLGSPAHIEERTSQRESPGRGMPGVLPFWVARAMGKAAVAVKMVLVQGQQVRVAANSPDEAQGFRCAGPK